LTGLYLEFKLDGDLKFIGRKMKYFCLFITLVSIFLAAQTKAQVLFEGYSKVSYNGQFIGFVIQRYEYNVGSKNFISTSIIKYNEAGGNITESLKAFSNEALEPLSYTYNLLSPKAVKTIEAKNTSGKLLVTTTEGGKKSTKEKIMPKGSFFSSFLAYVILKNPQGLKASTKYEYQAVAEEDGEIYKGTATVQSNETYKGLSVFKILNNFKNAQFLSYTTEKGEMLATMDPPKTLTLELVADPAQATGGLSISSENLKLLFGNIPEGKNNALAVASSVRGSAATPEAVVISSGTPLPLSKPDAVKGLELQEPPKSFRPGKQGTRKGLGIQTKSK
jgi:hypothetical protein